MERAVPRCPQQHSGASWDKSAPKKGSVWEEGPRRSLRDRRQSIGLGEGEDKVEEVFPTLGGSLRDLGESL